MVLKTALTIIIAVLLKQRINLEPLADYQSKFGVIILNFFFVLLQFTHCTTQLTFKFKFFIMNLMEACHIPVAFNPV